MMAESNTEANFARMLECSICLEKYRNPARLPKFLPCHHTMCVHCLQTSIDTHHEDEQFRCHMCQSEVECPRRITALNFVTNFQTLEEIEFSQKVKYDSTRHNNDILKLEGQLEVTRRQLEQERDAVQERANIVRRELEQEQDAAQERANVIRRELENVSAELAKYVQKYQKSTNKIAKLGKEMIIYQRQCETSNKKLQKERNEKDKLLSNFKQSQARIAKQSRDVTHLTQEVKKHQEKTANVQGELVMATEEKEKCELANKITMEKMSEQSNQIANLETKLKEEHKNYNHAISDCAKINEEKEQYVLKCKETKSIISTQGCDIGRFKTKIKQKSDTVLNLQRELRNEAQEKKQYQEKHKVCVKQLDSRTLRNNEMKELCDNQKREIKQLSDSIYTMKEKHKEEYQMAQKELIKVNENKQKIELEHKHNLKRLLEQSDHILTLEAQVADKNENYGEAISELKDTNAAENQYESKCNESVDIISTKDRRKLNKLKTESKKSGESLLAIRRELSIEMEERKRYQQKFEDCTHQLNKKEDKPGKTKKHCDNQKAEINALAVRIQTLKEKHQRVLEQTRREHDTILEKTRRGQDTILEQTRRKHDTILADAMKEANERHEEDIAKEKANSHHFSAKVDDIMHTNGQLKSQVSTLICMNGQLTRDIRAFQQLATNHEGEIETLDTILGQTRREHDTILAEAIKEANGRLKSQVSTLICMNGQLTQDIRDLRAQLKQLASNHEGEIETLHTSRDAMKQEMQSVLTENEQLRTELKDNERNAEMAKQGEGHMTSLLGTELFQL